MKYKIQVLFLSYEDKYKSLDPEGIYFVSFATVGWADVFTRLSTKKSLLIALDIASIKKTYFACLVSDDESCSFGITTNPKESRKEWMLNIFAEAGKNNSNYLNFQFWQQDNHPIEIFSPKVISLKIEYVHNNPVNTGIVLEAEQYIYSSAIRIKNTKRSL